MTNLFKTFAGAMLCTFALQTGCSSPTLQIKDPAGSNPADDVLTFQESMLGLIAASKTPEEASQRVTEYCDKNATAIGAAFSAMDRNADENATPAFMDRMTKLMERAEKALGDKASFMEHESFREAASRCRSMGQEDPELPEFGGDAEAPVEGEAESAE